MSRAGGWVNPVLARELTERMRGVRAAAMLTAYLAVLGMVLVLVYRAAGPVDYGPGARAWTQPATVGQTLFESTLLAMMLLVLFLVPGFTAGSVAGERERQTLVPMQVSLLSPVSIVLGKIWASAAFTLLLVVATLPLLTVAYLIGGITLGDIARGTGMVMFTAVAVAALAIGCSTLMRRVQTATVLSYGLVLVLCVATVVAYGVAEQNNQQRGLFDDPPTHFLVPNPVVGLASAVYDPDDGAYGYDSGPLSGIGDAVVPDPVFSDGDVAFGEFGIAPGFAWADDDVSGPGAVAAPRDGAGLPLWAQHILIIGALAAVAVTLSARRLRTPAKAPH